MTRNLIVLGCAALLAIGLSFGSFAGSIPDADGDGVPDQYDNCLNLPNGPDGATGACNSQEDGDPDGYGNPCDYDPNNDGASGLDDVFDTLDNQTAGSTSAVYDHNCDGAVGLDDVFDMLDNQTGGATPGPSGLACAGSIGCMAP